MRTRILPPYPHSPGLRQHRVSRTNLALNYMPRLSYKIPDLPPGADPNVRTPAASPPVDPYLTQAKLIAAALLDPEIKAQQRAIDQANIDAQARQKAYEGVMGAYGRLTEGMPAGVQAAYNTAAGNVSNYAGMVTGAVGAEAQKQASEAAAEIARIGVPGSGSVPTVDPNYMNSVAFSGGFIPARSLAQEAASAFTNMTGQRLASGAMIAQTAAQQLAKDTATVN